MALWVNDKLAGRSFVRMAYFTPTVLPLIAVANIWLFFYTPGFRPVRSDHWLSVRLAGIQLPRRSGNRAQCHHRGHHLERSRVLHDLLSGRASGNPRFSLKEAAQIEGAGRWTIFWRDHLPAVDADDPVRVVNAVINSFRLVDHIFILTDGGPDNASALLLFYIYEVAFRFWETAYGATLTVALLVLLSLLAIGQFFFFDRKVHYK
jgi:sn-glycerol 3-phosphate transport system permease protein